VTSGDCRAHILILPTTRWPRIKARAADVVAAVSTIKAGEVRELRW
jgi:hypothetical protein